MKNNIPLSPRQYEVAHQLPPELAINALSAFQADRLLQMYIDNYVPRWPVVLLPDANHEDLSRRRPLLARAVIAVVFAAERPSIAEEVQTQTLQMCTSSITSASILDLMQAVLVIAAFYTPPRDSPMEPNSFWKLANLALSSTYSLDVETPGEDHIERCRAYVGCFMVSQSISMATRRPSVMGSSTTLAYCIDHLANSDYGLSSLAELYQLVGEINEARRCDKLAGLGHDAVWQQAGYLRKKLQTWWDQAGLHVLFEPIKLLYHTAIAYTYEPVLYSEHQLTDLVVPFRFDRVGLTTMPIHTEPLSQAERTHLAQYITSIHSYLDVFVSMSPKAVRWEHTAQFIRLLYMVFVLTKLAMSLLDPRSMIGQALDSSQIKAEYYKTRVLDQMHAALSQGPCIRVQVFCDRLENLALYWGTLATHLRKGPPQLLSYSQAAEAHARPPEAQPGTIPPSTFQHDFVANTQLGAQNVALGSNMLLLDPTWDPTFFQYLDPNNINSLELDQLMTGCAVDWGLIGQA